MSNIKDLALSFSGLFICFEDNGQSPPEIVIARKPNYPGDWIHPLAKIAADGNIIGIEGNTGNRFDRLTAIEKADCATIVTRLHNDGVINYYDDHSPG